MPRATRNEALSDLSMQVFRLTARLNQLADRLSRQAGLSSARWQVLGTLERAGQALSVAEIARRMGLQRQSVQRTADALETEGFLSYVPNPRHRRAKLAELTTQGHAALGQMQELRDEWSDTVKQDLKLRELQQAKATLAQLSSMLENEN
ncbi:MAG: MarR family transcriptional regulator [Gammaproteobacteria bacterium]|nr:MarR family transcriptional regulator [Gammaproteobacteria bacterium]